MKPWHVWKVWRCGKHRVRRSLQARTTALSMMVVFLIAILSALFSMYAIRGSVQTQVMEESRKDFSSQITSVRKHLRSANLTDSSQYQQLIGNLASELQSSGPSNMIGVYLMSRDGESEDGKTVIPVSTNPEYTDLISVDMQSGLQSESDGLIYYQPVGITKSEGSIPGAILGSTIDSGGIGSLEVFVLYSYQSQQQSLTQIQFSMALASILLSVLIGFIIFLIMRSAVEPVQSVAAAAETMASGNLDIRVSVNRQDEIGVLQRSFNEMADSLVQKIDELEKAGDMQRSFVSDVSHELRTPVTTMRMASDMLSMHKNEYDHTTKRTVELLDGQIRRFQEMLADLLEISRFDAGYAALDLVESDIREPIMQVVDQVADIAKNKQVPLDVKLPNVEVPVIVDTRRIRRVVSNLLANAIDFAEGKSVEVRLAADLRMVVISVRDHGVGMTEEQCGKMFERFWRGDPSRARTTGGTGLGMAIALADVKLHHGDISVRSRMGEGTWFLVALPRNSEAKDTNTDRAPIRFVPGDDGFHTIGGFGIADNGFADYLTGETNIGKGRGQ